jgi:hypothetical protein
MLTWRNSREPSRLDKKIAASQGGLLRAQDFLKLIRSSETDHDIHWQISVSRVYA